MNLDPSRQEARQRLARFAISPSTVEQVREVARWGKGTVDRLAYSPDGRLLAVASSSGVYLYDAASKAELRFLDTGAFVWAAAFSPDGQEVAAAVNDGTVRIWNAGDGTAIRSLIGHGGAVLSVAYAPDGQTIVSGSVDQTARLWRRDDGSLVRTLNGHGDEVRGVAFSPDGQRVATASADKTARIWSVADGALAGDAARPRRSADQCGVLPGRSDGGDGLEGSDGAALACRRRRVAERKLKGHTGWVLDVAFSPDGQTLVTAAADNTARVWRRCGRASRCGRSRATPAGSSGRRFGRGRQQTIATGSRDGTIRFWRLQDGVPSGTIEGLSSLVRGVAVSEDGQTIAAGLENGTIVLLRASDGSADPDAQRPRRRGVRRGVLAGRPDAGLGLGRQHDPSLAGGGRLGGADADRPHGLGAGGAVRGRRAACCSAARRTRAVRVWRVADGANTRTIDEHEWGVSALAISPDAGLLATGTADTPIRLFRTAEQAPPQVLNGHTDWVNGLAISVDGQTLASASSDKTVRLWRLPDGSPMRTLQGHTDVVASVAFSADGQMVASSGWDATVRLWRAGDGGLARTLQGHTSDVNSVAMSADGQTLVSGSSDGTVRVWGVR